ncbi:Cell cycle serine/threonine-protein kinase cdc5/MSD2 [Lecanora helva]
MEPLSPRSTNIPPKPKSMKQKEITDDEAKKAEAAKKAQKEKDYAPPPPEWVLQPPIAKGGLAEKFKTGKCLGKGGFAVCYEGELRSKRKDAGNKTYALKVVRAKMNQRKMEEKFRTELQIHAKMLHPNIVEFHRAFTFKESTFVVLELCQNGSVMDMVKRRRCLTLPEVRRYTIQLCGAIKYMHARNVIHRDLKMGNLFLDYEMNLKIGDFGLAAVLVSPEEYQKGLYEYAKSRRTTLCGTPNYIAPEILEKGQGGHDYKVDIWAIGVIFFAMLVGQPPFQSTSQNEIYRRARNVEYEWPQTGKHQNDIPAEAKDLVCQLLKVEAEERPDPDQVIGHPFFAMHGGDAMPLMMEACFRSEIPSFLDKHQLPRGDVMRKGAQRLSLRTLAGQCGVGHLAGDVLPQRAVGGDIDVSMYGQCQAEEDAGDAPIVPMPKDMVYTSKFARGEKARFQAQDEGRSEPIDPDILMQDAPPCRPERLDHRKLQSSDHVPPVPSHAATLRAANKPLRSSDSRPRSEEIAPVQKEIRPRDAVAASTRGRRGLLNELPVRPTLKGTDAAGIEAKTLARNPRATRAKKVHVLDDDPPPTSKEAVSVTDAVTTKDQQINEFYSDPDAKRRDLSARTRARIATNVQNELANNAPESKISSAEAIAGREASKKTHSKTIGTLIGSDEVFECLPNTKPDEILLRLQNLHGQLEESLSSIKRSEKRAFTMTKDHDVRYRPVVFKWVDYTNKFGIGYILQNGTVGCVFKGDETSLPSCVVVANAERHLKKRKIAAYSEKHQMVHGKGAPVEFIENCDEDGLKRVFVQPSQYQVSISASGTPERLGPGVDVHDFEKRKRLTLWDKFGKYMTQTLGKSEDEDLQSLEEPNTSKSVRKNAAGPFVKFYQRLGNVGIWGFGDESFQFNFPDHTKLVISHGGALLDFYHLPVHAANVVKNGGTMDANALADRGVLSYPLTAMLSGCYRGHEFKDLIAANELHAKMTFIMEVVGIWASERGLGCMGKKKGMKWEGMMEKGGKLVWVTVGAKGGDHRYEMPAVKVEK